MPSPEKFKKSLIEHHVEQEVIDRINRGYEKVVDRSLKYHYEIILGVKLKLIEVMASPLDTEGEQPCIFRFQICK